MTGTVDEHIVVTMDDIIAASQWFKGRKPHIPVDARLEAYLLSVLVTMAAQPSSTGICAGMHTMLEIGISAGRLTERKRHAAETLALMKAVAEAPVVE